MYNEITESLEYPQNSLSLITLQLCYLLVIGTITADQLAIPGIPQVDWMASTGHR